MPSSPVDEIKSRLDIIELIGSYIKLAKAGRNYRARCPFHNEKTPSFMVSAERQIWHCFGCGSGGDIFAFVKQIEGIEFGDALRMLARRAGVVLKRQDPTLQTQRRRLYEICELAAKFFEKQLEAGKSGEAAKKYLMKDRGLAKETIKQWRIGWIPEGWRNLHDFLRQKGYRDQEIFDAGLIVKKSTDYGLPSTANAENESAVVSSRSAVDGYYDRFRSRIIFPLFDIQGQIVGFAGRIFGKDDHPPAGGVGKYINTPQTILYDKSRLLFGLNFAKMEIRQKNACVFVEGNLDVIMSHQAGAKNAVASSGTALTLPHLQIIKRYTDNLVFSFDTDQAGETATKRSIDLALENDFTVKIAQPIDVAQGKIAKDPADMIKEQPDKWIKAIENTTSVLDFYFSTTFARFPSTSSGQAKPEDKKQIAKIILPIIKRISNQIEQAHWLNELASRLKTDEKILYSELRKINPHTSGGVGVKNETFSSPAPYNNIEDQKNVQKSKISELEERIFSLFLNFPEHLKSSQESYKDFFFDEQLSKIIGEFKQIADKISDREKCLAALSKKLTPELSSHVDRLFLKDEQYETDPDSALKEIQECQKALKVAKIKEQMQKLGFDIKEAQIQNSKKLLEKSLNDFKELSNKLTELSK